MVRLRHRDGKSRGRGILAAFEKEGSTASKIALGVGVLIFILLLLDPSVYITRAPLQIGDIAPRDIMARNGFLVEYKEATKARTDEVRRSVRAVYDFDVEVTANILEGLCLLYTSDAADE